MFILLHIQNMHVVYYRLQYREHSRRVSFVQTYYSRVFGCCSGYRQCGAACCREDIIMSYLCSFIAKLMLNLNSYSCL